MNYEIAELPYAYDALEPYISAETLETHYGKHHQGYVDKLNKTKYGRQNQKVTLEKLIQTEKGDVFNLAAQVWNHAFYWNCLSSNGGGNPSDLFAPVISHQFGSVDKLKIELADVANSEFGSGWAWLVIDSDKEMKVLSTPDAENPMQEDLIPLFTLDVWEHAYYLDYKNERDGYVNKILDQLINWEFIEEQYNQACQKSE